MSLDPNLYSFIWLNVYFWTPIVYDMLTDNPGHCWGQQNDLSKHKFVQSLQCFPNFQTTCRVLLMLLYIALLPTVSHYSMKLQSVYTRSPGLPLLTGAAFSFYGTKGDAVNRWHALETAWKCRTTFISFPSFLSCAYEYTVRIKPI